MNNTYNLADRNSDSLTMTSNVKNFQQDVKAENVWGNILISWLDTSIYLKSNLQTPRSLSNVTLEIQLFSGIKFFIL